MLPRHFSQLAKSLQPYSSLLTALLYMDMLVYSWTAAELQQLDRWTMDSCGSWTVLSAAQLDSFRAGQLGCYRAKSLDSCRTGQMESYVWSWAATPFDLGSDTR